MGRPRESGFNVVAVRGKLMPEAYLRDSVRRLRRLDVVVRALDKLVDKIIGIKECGRAEAIADLRAWVGAPPPELEASLVMAIERGPWIPNKRQRRAFLSKVTGKHTKVLRQYIYEASKHT